MVRKEFDEVIWWFAFKLDNALLAAKLQCIVLFFQSHIIV